MLMTTGFSSVGGFRFADHSFDTACILVPPLSKSHWLKIGWLDTCFLNRSDVVKIGCYRLLCDRSGYIAADKKPRPHRVLDIDPSLDQRRHMRQAG